MKPRIHRFRESLYLLARNKLSLIALIGLVILVAVAILAPYIAPYPEDFTDAAGHLSLFIKDNMRTVGNSGNRFRRNRLDLIEFQHPNGNIFLFQKSDVL